MMYTYSEGGIKVSSAVGLQSNWFCRLCTWNETILLILVSCERSANAYPLGFTCLKPVT